MGVTMILSCSDSKVGQDKKAVNNVLTQVVNYENAEGKNLSVSVSTPDSQAKQRTYTFVTQETLRDDAPQEILVKEKSELPAVRTGDLMFDGLFALGVNEMSLDSVSEIKDSAYNSGNPIPCECFETGEKWHYVWTRDLAYAAYLSLGFLDPQRTVNSLLFKTSRFRAQIPKADAVAGDDTGLQVIQDTGSGGSWPISTDRVTWAFGAEAALNSLPKSDRQYFAQKALIALSNTIENDRNVAFDKQTGLYTGEQSFLDWREQTYAAWIPDELISMATSKAISTNAAHYQALTVAAKLALEAGEQQRASRYTLWAQQLKSSINQHLWLEDAGMYSSLTAGHYDNMPMHKFDWLGQSLAIITGIADSERQQKILRHYPHGPMGAPVIFPQQLGVPVYHNRAIWPFVTAYGLKAAKIGKNQAVANRAYDTLIRSAALNLSNMENLEWLSGQAWYDDPDDTNLSGPVINSKRQLWSVAAYLHMVVENIFGVSPNANYLVMSPYLTTHLVDTYFARQSVLSLSNLHWRGKTLNITMHIPKDRQGEGVFKVNSLRLNNKEISDNRLTEALLLADNKIDVYFEGVEMQDQEMTHVEGTPEQKSAELFAPLSPSISVSTEQGKTTITLQDEKNLHEVSYTLFKNGKQLVAGVAKGTWIDEQQIGHQACYSAMAVHVQSGLQSHHSQVHCVHSGQEIAVDSPSFQSNISVTRKDNQPVLLDWGKPSDQLVLSDYAVSESGRFAVQFRYHNSQHAINTGITAGVKWLMVTNAEGKIVGEGPIVMPHIVQSQGYSTPLTLALGKGVYQFALHDYYNMSYLQTNSNYSAAGGETGPVNQVDMFAIKIMPML